MIKPTLRVIGFVWDRSGFSRVAPRLTSAIEHWHYARGGTSRIVHSAWILDYSVSHCGRCRVGEESADWRERPPSVAHLYPPGTPYWEDYGNDPERLHHSAYISFQGGEAAGLPELAGPAGYVRIEDPRNLLGGMLREAAAIGHKLGNAGFWKAQAILCRLIDRLRESRRIDGETRQLTSDLEAKPTSQFVEQVGGFLRERLNRKVTHVQLARQLNMSVSTLAHRYRAETGETVMISLHKMRMNLAAELLRHGMRVKEVAQECGFYDEFHFSKSFKSHYGVPPRIYASSDRREPAMGPSRRRKQRG